MDYAAALLGAVGTVTGVTVAVFGVHVVIAIGQWARGALGGGGMSDEDWADHLARDEEYARDPVLSSMVARDWNEAAVEDERRFGGAAF